VKTKTLIFTLPILSADVLVHFGLPETFKREVQSRLEPEYQKEFDGLFEKPCNGLVAHFGRNRIAVYLGFAPKKKMTAHELAVIAHESLHVVQQSAEYVGAEPCNELMCRFQQYVFETILNELQN